jgi:hypothetical protein
MDAVDAKRDATLHKSVSASGCPKAAIDERECVMRLKKCWTVGSFAGLAALTAFASAQSIDFETLPDGSPIIDEMFISDQYQADFGVRFDLVDPVTLLPTGSPQIAEVGAPQTAFNGCGPDTPLDDQQIGSFFLTDDTSVSNTAGTLLLTYSNPVAQSAGAILDVDTRSGGNFEEWTIEALASDMSVLETRVITAPTGPGTCNATAGPGDATAIGFVFDRANADIHFIVLRYTGTANSSIGLAFDNFSPTSIPDAPSVALTDPPSIHCLGDAVTITPDITDGLAGFAYQWQRADDITGPFVDMVGVTGSTLDAPALPGRYYRVVITDTLGRSATSNPVTIATRPVSWTLSFETAAGSGVYDTIATDIEPIILDDNIDTYWGWLQSEQYFHGSIPTLTVNRAHLFVTVGAGGQSLVFVLDAEGTNAGGRAETRASFTNATPEWMFKDDPGDTYRDEGTPVLRARNNWGSPNTDGWAIGPLNGSWAAEVEFTDTFSGTPTIEGLDDLAFYDADGTEYILSLEVDRRVRVEAVCSCLADLNSDGALDFFDIQAFLGMFAAGAPAADFNSDGVLDFFDVQAYLGLFAAGCP